MQRARRLLSRTTCGVVIGLALFNCVSAQNALAQTNSVQATQKSYDELSGQKKYAQLLEVLDRAIEHAPAEERLHLLRGSTYCSIYDYRSGSKDFDAAIAASPDDAEALADKAICLARQGSLEEAVATMRSAAAKKTNDASITSLIAMVLLEAKDYSTTFNYLKDFNFAAVKDKKLAAAIYLVRSQAQAATGQFESALSDLNAGISGDSTAQTLYLARGRLYQKQNKFAEAIADGKKAIELQKGKLPRAHLLVGECQLAIDKIGEAEQEFHLAAQELGHEQSGELQYYKALVVEKKGNFLGGLSGKAEALKLGYFDPPPLNVITHPLLVRDKVFNSFQSVVAGEHFLCYGDFDRTQLSYYSKVAEGLANYTDSSIVKISGDYPAYLFMLRDKGAEQHFLSDRMGFRTGVHGVFITDKNAIVSYDGAGVGVFLHEIMHKLLYQKGEHDFWADEGVPNFFEKSYGYLHLQESDAHADKSADKLVTQQELFLQTGYPEFTGRFWTKISSKTLKLSQIVTSAKYADHSNEEAQRLVALFVNQQGKLARFLELTSAGKRGNYKYFIEAAFEKSLSDLDPSFDLYVADLNNQRDLISKLPPAKVFERKQEYDEYIEKHHLMTRQNAVKKFAFP